MKIASIVLAGLASLLLGACSSPQRPKANTYLAPQGNAEYVRRGFERVSLGMAEDEIIEAVGHPYSISPWREMPGKMSLTPGKKLGTKYSYWLKVASYDAVRSYNDDRWLEFCFNPSGRLVRIEGNLSGKHFTRQAQQGVTPNR